MFDALVNSAARLFGPCGATITTLTDGKLHWNATGTSLPDFDFKRARSVYPIPFDPERSPSARAILERRIIEIPDVEAPDTPEFTRQAASAGGFKSITFVPLVSQDKGIGSIILNHPQAGFRLSEHQLALVQTFADQAVIAIENARLFNETQEALERQTATSDILKVIAASPSDVQPVFDAIAASANRLIGGFSTTVFRFIDGQMHLKAFTRTSPAGDEMLQSLFPQPLAGFPIFELVSEGETAQFTDTEAESVPPEMRDLARSRGFRSMLFTPLMNNGASIGMIGITRPDPGAFPDHHVQLLQTFADQAVIAIENVRLFDEVQARTNDLIESLQQQTATADVLKVISRSVFDLQTVLDTLVESAYKLCGADLGLLYLKGEESFECKAIAGSGVAEASQLFKGRPILAGRGTAAERVILTGEVHNVPDFDQDPEFDPNVRAFLRRAAEAGSSAGQLRSTLAVPMTRDNIVVGVMVIARTTTGPFPARQIELLQTFADQAVIAIENARLFDEVEARTRDLCEVAAAADRDRRCAQGDQPLGVRPADRARHAGRIRRAAVRGGRRHHLPAARRRLPPGRKLRAHAGQEGLSGKPSVPAGQRNDRRPRPARRPGRASRGHAKRPELQVAGSGPGADAARRSPAARGRAGRRVRADARANPVPSPQSRSSSCRLLPTRP